jgi:mannosyltransferase
LLKTRAGVMGTTGAIPETTRTEAGARRPATGRGQRLGTPRSEQVRDALAVAVPALVAAGLCFYELGSRSLWLDESATVAIASQHGAAFGNAVAHDGGNMLGYYTLLHVLIGLFGKGAFLIRAPSALAAAASAAIVGVIALRIAGRRAAIASASLAAVSLPLVYWGQDARGYAVMVALISGSFLALLALLRADAGWRPWLAYAALTTAAVYAGLEAALVVPAQLVVLLWFRNRARAVISAAVAAAVCCAPLAVLAANRGSGQLFWVPPPSLPIAKQVAQALASSGLQPSFYTSTGTALLVLTAVVLVIGVAAMLSRRGGGQLPRWALALMLSWLLVPATLALLESAVGQSVFQARYLLVSLPAVALLLGLMLADQRVPRALALSAFVALLVLRALQLVPAYGVSPENWRAATAHVMADARRGDCSAFYPLDSRMPFQYYLTAPARAPRPVLPALSWTVVRPFVEDYSSLSAGALARLPSSCKRVWLVASHEGRVGGPPVSRGNFTRFLELTAALGRRYPHSRVTSFGYHSAVTVTLFTGAR